MLIGGVIQTDFLQKPNNIQKLKVPPHSMEAEQCVIGSMLNDPDSWDKVTELVTDSDSWDKVTELVTDSDFYNRSRQLIFKDIIKLLSETNPIDLITVSESLEQNNLIHEAGGFAYLGELAKNTPNFKRTTNHVKSTGFIISAS